VWAALAALLLVGCDTPVTSSDEAPGIAFVNERRRTDADVARASEAVGAKDTAGSDVIFRTDASGRGGHYFFVKLEDAPPADAKLVLQVVRTENAAPERYEFPARFRPGFPFGEYVIGLTGKQAGDAKWRPIAWRLSVVDAKGKVLAAKHSFLWGTPRDLGR
jgi:hypothetical protein